MLHKYVVGFFVILTLISCKSEYKFILNTPTKIQSNQILKISISEKNGKPIKSVQFSIDDQKITSEGTSASININDYKLGKHQITALVFYEDKTEKVTNPVYFMADSSPDIYTYKIINIYPHDKEAYTQGLEYRNGYLYEGTGRKGTSFIRKVELETGRTHQIRVHFAALRHPLVGDLTYGADPALAEKLGVETARRIAGTAQSLTDVKNNAAKIK